MRAPSEPAINRDNPAKYFIYWNHDVPAPLWDKYGRKRVRIKKYDDINRFRGDEREAYAENRRQVWKYALNQLKYNPFEEELAALAGITSEITQVVAEIDKKVIASKKKLSEEDRRKALPIESALQDFIKSRKA